MALQEKIFHLLLVTFIDRRPSEAEEEGEVCGMKEIELRMSGITLQDTVNITKQPVQVTFNVQIYIQNTYCSQVYDVKGGREAIIHAVTSYNPWGE